MLAMVSSTGHLELDSVNASSQVKITPEMIEAGLEPYFSFEDGADDPKQLVCAVFRAMLASWQQSNSIDHAQP